MIPYFGQARMVDITQANIQEYLNTHSFLAQSNLKRHQSILHSVFEQAVLNDICYKNPVCDVSYKSTKPAIEKIAYTEEQSKQAQEYAKFHSGGLAVYLILNTGLRRSEALGLMWGDIDFNKKAIMVKRSITPDIVIMVEKDQKIE